MTMQALAHWNLYRLTYTVRGRSRPSHIERYAATRRAAETAALPVLALSWQIAARDIAVTRIVEVAQ